MTPSGNDSLHLHYNYDQESNETFEHLTTMKLGALMKVDVTDKDRLLRCTIKSGDFGYAPSSCRLQI